MGCCEATTGNTSQPYTQHNRMSGLSQKTWNHPLFNGEFKEAARLCNIQKYADAAQIYRKHLQALGEETAKIDGVGQLLMSIGYYQWDPLDFYIKGIDSQSFIGTVYDALSLCYLMLKDNEEEIEKGMKWYMDMIDDHCDNVGFLLGYANILTTKTFYEEAIDYYERILDLETKWTKPLQCLAYIYEYKRVDKKKSCEIANKLLLLEPNNLVGLFVLGRNGKTPQEKIQKLKQLMNIHSKYARGVNEIGIVYGGTLKKYTEAITWYQQASIIRPQYASCYNNIGVNYELLKNYEEAIVWYFKGIEKDKEYKAPHANLSDVFDELKATDEVIQGHMAKYNIKIDYFYYYMGLAYYDKGKYQESIKYYMKAYDCLEELGKHVYKLDNSIGITYDDMKQNEKAKEYYLKSIKVNPKYHSAYYNIAIVFKGQKNFEQAKSWYKKAIEVNPRYSYAFNNLGNIYKDETKYEEAIKMYKAAIQHLSTYTLALANLGMCYLKLENYREAFNAMERAKECLPTDNNNLSSANKSFLKENLDKFDKEGESWRQNGCITKEQRQKLKNLVSSFESNFSKVKNQGKEPVSIQKVLKKQILEIVRLTYEDQFQLKSIEKVYDLVRDIYNDNEEYFHIIPQLFIQYFYANTIQKQRPILEVEKELYAITKKLSEKTVAAIEQKKEKKKNENKKNPTIKMTNFKPEGKKVNLFKMDYFDSYEAVYAEIMNVNEQTGQSYQDFKKLIDAVKKGSYGTIYGVGTKIPKDETQQFKVILRIFQKMFKAELTKEKVQSLIENIDEALKKKVTETGNSKNIGLGDIVPVIMETWTKEITKILTKRREEKKKTVCEVSDLLRAKVMFDSLDHLKKAISIVNDICNAKGYEVIELDDRLDKIQTQDVVFKIKIKAAVCEFQLAIKQDQTAYHFTHSIYEIERSPLGCIFGSYIFMSKGVHYPFSENCADIAETLKNSTSSEDQKTLIAAKYIVDKLSN